MIVCRSFVLTLIVGVLIAPLATEAQQQAGKVARIGYLSSGTATENARLHKAFTDGLRDYGWIEGKNIAVEYRWDITGESTLDALAAELARLPLDVIFAVNTPASLATKRTGTTLPVVFATVSEPVGIGLVDSLARPGRNFTGFTTINRELLPIRLTQHSPVCCGGSSGEKTEGASSRLPEDPRRIPEAVFHGGCVPAVPHRVALA